MCLATLVGQTTAENQSQQQPTFSGRAELVLVDVVVTDHKSQPIKGLTAADFVVKEDGAVRPILAFEAIEGGRRATLTREPAAAGSPPSAGTPEEASVAVLIDDQHLSPGQAAATQTALRSTISLLSAREATLMLVAPESRISVAAQLPFGAGRMVAATYNVRGKRVEDRGSFPVADHEALQIVDGDRRALARVVSRFVALNPDLSEGGATMFARNRATETADAARRSNKATYGVALLCLDWLESRLGRRHLVIVSSGLARDAAEDRYKSVIARSLQLNVPVHFVDARTLAGAGRYQSLAYGVNLGRDADEGSSARIDESAGLVQLAADTGGLTVGGTNDLDESMQRLLETMSAYYILAYQPPPKGTPGFRRIEVTTSRPGVLIRARRGYEAR
jgi:VWFA-related protein